ncbi:hypothetical protein [uncultured Fibrobacter sp.]|uniref:hypothetical protein n=1 Tax=uncultured Fibrobacter sp. TaxID=261512 RepID=UPI002603DE3D|nr:hypothetical protein [uncultured Fibrobacter sp.]
MTWISLPTLDSASGWIVALSADLASVTTPLAVLYILCSFLRTCEWGLTDGDAEYFVKGST